MPMRCRDLIKIYVGDLKQGDMFTVDDVQAWFKKMWPRYVPSTREIGSNIKSLDRVLNIDCGIYEVIA